MATEKASPTATRRRASSTAKRARPARASATKTASVKPAETSKRQDGGSGPASDASWTERATEVAGQVGEALGHAVGSIQIEAKRAVVDGKKLLHRAQGEARDMGRETVRQVKAHPWATSGVVVGAGALIGAAVAGYSRVRGKR